jgi:hypothetical protein
MRQVYEAARKRLRLHASKRRLFLFFCGVISVFTAIWQFLLPPMTYQETAPHGTSASFYAKIPSTSANQIPSRKKSAADCQDFLETHLVSRRPVRSVAIDQPTVLYHKTAISADGQT